MPWLYLIAQSTYSVFAGSITKNGRLALTKPSRMLRTVFVFPLPLTPQTSACRDNVSIGSLTHISVEEPLQSSFPSSTAFAVVLRCCSVKLNDGDASTTLMPGTECNGKLTK